MAGLLGYENPFLRGMMGARQQNEASAQREIARTSGLLNIENARMQQQQAQKDQELKGLLGQKLAAGDQEGVKALLMQYKPELFAKSMIPQQPKWQVTERFNDQTGRAEKVMIDMNDPTKVMPFGGQKASPVQVAPNGMTFDPLATKPGQVFADPSKPVIMGPNGPMVNPLAVQARSQIAAAGRPSITNKVTMGQETEENKAIGRELGKQYADIQQSGVSANSKIAKLDRMSQLSSGISTGKLTPAMTEVAALADSLGVKVDKNLGPKQAFEALSNEVALSLRSTGDGAGMPGAMSDKDREFLKAMTPSLSKTPEGNKLIIESGIKLAKRQQEVAKLARDYRQKNKTLEGFSQYLQDWANKNPLFTTQSSNDDLFSKADAILGGR